jgi:hypothetical protein
MFRLIAQWLVSRFDLHHHTSRTCVRERSVPRFEIASIFAGLSYFQTPWEHDPM